MKNLRMILVLLLALACGIIASAGAYKYLKGKEELLKVKLTPPTQNVVVACRKIPLGTAIKQEDIKVEGWLKDNTPKGSFLTKGELIGRVTKREIIKGEAMLPDFLLPEGGILWSIPIGMRAMSVEVDKVISVHGFIQPGSYVDVIATIKAPEHENELIAKIILQNVKVLAIGNTSEMEELSEKRDEITAVTFALAPQDVEKLTLAINRGKIHLVLRNYKDRDHATTYGTTSDTLLGRVKGPEKKATYKVVEVIKGEERSEMKFETDSSIYIKPEAKDPVKASSKIHSEYKGE